MRKPDTYAELIRRAMRAKRMTRRDLEKATEYSYEHIRKIVSGLPLMSEDFNERVCNVLGLNADELWTVAQREKLRHSHGTTGPLVVPDTRIKDLWSELTAHDQDRVLKIVEGLAEMRRLEREERALEDPGKIRQRIIDLTGQLTSVREGEARRRRVSGE